MNRNNHMMTNKKHLLTATIALLLTMGSAYAQGIGNHTETTPSAHEILQQVRASFPPQPLRGTAELIAKNKRGKVIQKRNLDFYMAMAGTHPTATYVLSDAFGEELERITITRPEGQPPQQTYVSRTPEAPDQINLTAPIKGLDFSWSDLCFDFLWWTNATLTGMDQKLNRDCYIMDVRPPHAASNGQERTRLWIDQKTHGLLQAENMSADNQLQKKLTVKSLQKINGLRTIGDVEIRSYPSRTKTRMRIRDLVMEPPIDLFFD